MPRFDGSLARMLDFGEATTAGVEATSSRDPGRAGLRLAAPGGAMRGPDKYNVLERRRRRAQIAARRAVDLIDAAERGETPGTEEGK